MTVPMTGTASRYTRVGVALAVAAAAVVGSATASSAGTAAAGTASPLTGAASTVITVTAAANTFKSGAGVAKVNPLSTAANSVLFSVAACPTNTVDGSSNVTTAPPTAAKMLTDLVTHDQKTITTATGTFLQSDVGKVITTASGSIPAATTIMSVAADGKSATLSAAATAHAAQVTTIANTLGAAITDGVTYDGTDLKIYSKQAANATAANSLFNLAATGSISGNGIAAGATFTGVSPGTYASGVLTAPASATLAGSGVVSGGVLLATATGNGAFATTSAPVTAATAVYPAAAVTVVSGTKLIVKAPAFAQAGAYNICVFDSTSSLTTPTQSVIASGAYTVANVLAAGKYTVATAPSGITVLPASGPSGSATAITITGSALGSAPTATLGGTALALKAVTGQANTFTATAPAHAPGATALVVSTTGGPAPAATFTYLDGITVAPTTGVAATSTVLDITGAGFLTGTVPLTFDASDTSATRLTDTNAHVFLVKGQYTNTIATTNVDSAECTNVTVVSDLELICTLDTTGSLGVPTTVNTPNALLPNGAYQVVLVSSAAPAIADPLNSTAATYRQTIITSASTFTVAPY